MQLRTARRGPRSGRQFWGCVRYPKCKGLVPTDGDPLAARPGAPEARLPQGTFPVVLSAAPRHVEGQTAFFQAVGFPASLLDGIRDAEIDRATVRSISQWRLDFPLPSVDRPRREERDLILAVAETILTRGATPLCSVALEQALGQMSAGPVEPDDLVEALQTVATWPTCRFLPVSYESHEEQLLGDWVRGLCTTEDLPWTLMPQIELASLASTLDPSRAQRGDLLLLHARTVPVLVEVDGLEHEAHQARDEERDRALAASGVRVVRIATAEITRNEGPGLDELGAALRQVGTDHRPETALGHGLRWCKFVHQVQLALLTALRGGWLDVDARMRIGVDIPRALADDPQGASYVERGANDLLELLSRLARLYGRAPVRGQLEITVVNRRDFRGTLDVVIGAADGSVDDVPSGLAPAQFLVSDLAFPAELRAPLTAAIPTKLTAPLREDARWFLQYLFRKDDFWDGQWETVGRTLRGEDSVVLLPTGGGKSIAFQLAALLLPGRCIVVDPIISLIDDQIDNLASVGVDRCVGITSQLHASERERALQEFRTGHYLFCYVAPERFQSISFREALRTLTTHTPINLVVIDEAHCVSEWGHDFRTAYLNLGRIAREYCASQGAVPPLIALTGTASRVVLKDVQWELGIRAFDGIITPKNFDRPELHFSVIPCRSIEKIGRVEGFLGRLPGDFAVDRSRFFRPSGSRTHAGLVFCPHVDGPYGVVEIGSELARRLGTQVDIYSGGPPNSVDRDTWDVRKRRVALQYKRNRTSILACTKAFGMGIDKPNIRYTLHVGLPGSIESFYQEAGRAGRDRRRAECGIVLSNDDALRSQRLLSPEVPLEEVAEVVEKTERGDEDDIVRALWFHVRAFRGEDADLDDITRMCDTIGDLGTRRLTNISWDKWPHEKGRGDDRKQRAEKALHRLVVIGVVEDYTIDYSAHEFGVRLTGASQQEIATRLGQYTGAYQRRLGEKLDREILTLRPMWHRQLVLAAAQSLISFIYEHVELARRRALNEMLQAANRAAKGEDLRRRILDYLQQSEWDERLDQLRGSRLGGVDALSPILDDLVSPNDAASLRGAAARLLGSYPDVPGLLFVRAVAEVLCTDADPAVVDENLGAAVRFGFGKYGLGTAELAAAIGQMVWRAGEKEGAASTLLQASIRAAESNRSFIRELLREVPIEHSAVLAAWLNQQLAAHCSAMMMARRE